MADALNDDGSSYLESYIIASTKIPSNTYLLGNNYYLRPIAFKIPKSMNEDELPHAYAFGMALSKIDLDSLTIYKKLIVFHSFMDNSTFSGPNKLGFSSQDSITYVYAENSDKIGVHNEKLHFLTARDLGSEATDFNHFPITYLDSNGEPITTYLNYGQAFWIYCNLKTSSKYKALYNQMQLFEFSRNFTRLHRIYSNANIPPAFYVAILDSLLGRPKLCSSTIDECLTCHRKHVSHETESWVDHFTNHYGPQFKEYAKRRNVTFHQADFMDFFEEWDRINDLDEDEFESESEKFDKQQLAADELQEIAYSKLLNSFMEIYNLKLGKST